MQERPERRARSVALIGLVFQILITAFFSVLAAWSGSEAMWALTQMTGVGILIWLTIVLVYHQRVLVQEESFESEQLRREREAGLISATVFDLEDEALLLARRRLRWMYRWVLPIAAVLIIAALAASTLATWNWGLTQPISGFEWKTIQQADLLVWFLGGCAFLCFLLSRYAIGMARQPEWQMLRAGAAYLMGMTLAAVAMVAVLGAMLMSEKGTPWVIPEHVLAYVLRYLMLALAVEFALNLVLDFYRPRQPDEEPRPAFDSRLLGLFTEPGGIARSIAEAINYQFGFEVSSTWFYKLIERSAVPLVGFSMFCLLMASCLVFVGQEERVVVERYGRRLGTDLGSGLHVKLPWPIDKAFPVGIERVHDLQIGMKPAEEKTAPTEELILWTNKHAQEPHLLVLVATPKLAEFLAGPPGAATRPASAPAVAATRPSEGGKMAESSEAVSVSLLRVALRIEYQILDAYRWLTGYQNPGKMLEAIANREIIQYFASADVPGVLGQQRGPIENELRQAIQKAADKADLGVKVVYLGLQGVHPPEAAAEAFQDVVGAEQKKTATIRSAWSDYNKKLSEAAGDVGRAEQLDKAIRLTNRLTADPKAPPAQVEAARQRRDVLFLGDQAQGIRPVGGQAISRIAQARADRWRLENEAHGRAVTFEQEMALKKAAPEVYTLRRYLTAVADSVKGIRKYVIASQRVKGGETFHLDIRDPMQASLSTALEKKEP